ncbi:MAG: hypothetical protein P4L27_02415 [Ignavibacteriaceae bacterium]|nr:hypothetical protein [Ignavibacteriaceae bacterium]
MNILKLFFAVAFSSVICFSQTNIADVLYPRSPDTLVYSDFPAYTLDELNNIQNSIEAPKMPNDNCQFRTSDFLDTSRTQYFRKIDLNGDGQLDIIYSLNYCADELLNLIWIKQNNIYKFSTAYYGTISRLIKNQNKDYSLLIRTGYCCGGYVGYYRLYSPFDFDKDIIRFIEKRINICEFINTQFPTDKISPRKFVILNDKAPLRTSHEINNSLDSLRSHAEINIAVYGNIVAEYIQGSTGKLISEFSDSLGEHWYFVLMDNKNLMNYNRFYRDNDTYKCGWINSKDIKIL